MCFFFVTTERKTTLLKSSIGPCQSCGGNGTVNLVEERSKCHFYGVIPSPESVEQMALCSQCGKSVTADHYRLQEQAKLGSSSSKEPEEVAISTVV